MKIRILLIGAGRFGKVHLDVLSSLHRRAKLELLGVVVHSEKTRTEIDCGIPVFTHLSESLLRQADAVDIVTPVASHASLIKDCLPYAHVFVEKPLAPDSAQAKQIREFARKQKHVLFVGHVYRFHPVITWLKNFLNERKMTPQRIESKLLNGLDSGSADNVKLEFLHPFDIADYLFERPPLRSCEVVRGQSCVVYLQYAGDANQASADINARFEVGYAGDRKVRTLELDCFDRRLRCDLGAGWVEMYKNNRLRQKIDFASQPTALEHELLHFLSVIRGQVYSYPNVTVASRILEVVEGVRPINANRQPRVAVIGAGIFGANCAAELADGCAVSLFERHGDLMTESSFVNQYRHHWGYHYPLSDETVAQCRTARSEFESVYKSAIVNICSYYAISKHNAVISGTDYLRFCERNGLPVHHEMPPAGFLASDRFAVSLRTPEAVYDYAELKRITQQRLATAGSVAVHLETEVISGRLNHSGSKELLVQKGGQLRWHEFDFVVNATYAFTNQFRRWFHFPIKPLRLWLKEILVLRLPAPCIGITAWMGDDFAALIPTPQENIFTFAYMPTALIKGALPASGLVPAWGTHFSKWRAQLRHGKQWFPLLSKATFLESRLVTLGINAWHEYDYARTSDITDHGFGCWSVLGGKIITCVSTAREIRRRVWEAIPANAAVLSGREPAYSAESRGSTVSAAAAVA